MAKNRIIPLLLVLPTAVAAQTDHSRFRALHTDADVRQLFVDYQAIDIARLRSYRSSQFELEDPTYGMRLSALAWDSVLSRARSSIKDARIDVSRIDWISPRIVAVRGRMRARVNGQPFDQRFLTTLHLDTLGQIRHWTDHFDRGTPRVTVQAEFMEEQILISRGFRVAQRHMASVFRYTDKSLSFETTQWDSLVAFAQRTVPTTRTGAALRAMTVQDSFWVGGRVVAFHGTMHFADSARRGFSAVVTLDENGQVVNRVDHYDIRDLQFNVAARPPQARAFTSDHISVVTRGAGPDVILIHGLGGHRDEWGQAADDLARRYRLHLVQMLGFGGFARPSADSLVAAPAAREVARYIRETGLTRPTLIGHSMGGTIVMMVAARHPDLPGRVMVLDMVPFLGGVTGQPNPTAESVRPIADQIRTQIFNTQAGSADDLIAQTVVAQTRNEGMRPVLVQHANASDRRTVAHAMHELIVTDLRPELSLITVPLTVLYVIPNHAPLPPEKYERTLRHSYGNARTAILVRIEDSNHYIQLDQPARLVAEVDAFMRRHAR